MLKQRFDASPAAVLAKQENLVAACEIYNERSGIVKTSGDLNDPVVEFLAKPENADLVGTICKEFPNALRWLAKMVLFKGICDGCRKQLQSARKWKIVPDPEDDNSLMKERWPSIYIEPRSVAGEQWSFCFSIDTGSVPFRLDHGIVYSENGGQPKSMGKELQSAVNQVENEFKKIGFNVKKWQDNGWFAQTDKPYKEYTLGANPSLLAGIFTRELADPITKEFVQLFLVWSQKIEHLNSLLRTSR
jgi:hypothetical protein